jgi:hypothetical protein
VSIFTGEGHTAFVGSIQQYGTIEGSPIFCKEIAIMQWNTVIRQMCAPGEVIVA